MKIATTREIGITLLKGIDYCEMKAMRRRTKH